MKTKLTLLIVVFFQILSFGQNDALMHYSEDLVRNFYENLNNFADKSYDEADQLGFREEIENNILRPGKTILVNDLYKDGSKKLSPQAYLDALNGYFPIQNNNAKFEISNVVADVPKTITNNIVCKVYYDSHFTGIFNDKSKLDKKNKMIAIVIFPGNEMKRAFISKTSFSSAQEMQEVSDRVKNYLSMTKEWIRIKDSSNPDDFRRFLNKYENSEYSTLAEANLKNLEMKDESRQEKEDWIEAKELNTIKAYKIFLRKHPYSEFAKKAKIAKFDLEKIEEDKKDKKRWQIAKSKNTVKSYTDYIKYDDLGLYVEQARKKIKELNSKDTSIYSYSGKKLGGAGSALYSLIVPGWGDYKVNSSKAPYFIIGAVAYGLTGTGGYYYSQYLSNLDKYKNATNPAKIKEYKSLYDKQYNTSIYLLGAGVAVWLTDVVLVAIKGNKNTKEFKRKNNKYSFTPFTTYDTKYDMVNVGLKLKF